MGCAKISKGLLIVFNCLFFLVGIALLAVGLYIIFSPYSFEILSVLDNGIIQAGVYAIVCIGALVFVIAGLGLLGTVCSNKLLLGLYLIVLFFIIAAQIVVCAIVVSYRNKVDSFVTSQLLDTMDNYVTENATNSFSVAWNSIQIYFQCCGTKNYTDWATTEWGTNDTIFKYVRNAGYPITCCAIEDKLVVVSGTINLTTFTDVTKCYGGSEEGIPSRYMAGGGDGCYQSFANYVISNSIVVGGMGIGLASFEILLFILAIVVLATMGKDENVV